MKVTFSGPHDDLFTICHDHLEDEMDTLDPTIQEVIRHRYGYYGRPKHIRDISTCLGMSVRIVGHFKEEGIQQLRERISYEDTKTMLYHYQNQRKVFK